MGVVVRQVTHRAGSGVLRDVSLSFEGGLLAVLGPAGAGKSTLLTLMAGLARPKRGQVEVYGRSAYLGDVRERIGYVPAEGGLTPGMTVGEALDFYLMLRRVQDPEERRSRIAAVIERLGLHGADAGPTSTIPASIGFLMSIAQALLCEPHLLIVREPADLTVQARSHARAILRACAPHRAVVLATDEPHGIEEIADQVCILEAGKVRLNAAPHDVTATASGHTWETEVGTGQEVSFLYGFVATREERTPQGKRIRGVSHGAPAPQARAVPPEFFDGYTWCLATDEVTVGPEERPTAAPV